METTATFWCWSTREPKNLFDFIKSQKDTNPQYVFQSTREEAIKSAEKGWTLGMGPRYIFSVTFKLDQSGTIGIDWVPAELEEVKVKDSKDDALDSLDI